jgi:formamidopyrimidine-DNA glycosylase
MPELPDIEVLRRRILKEVKGETITRSWLLYRPLYKGKGDLEKRIKGKKIRDAKRHGKYLFLELSPDLHLAVHFGLTGDLIFNKPGEHKWPPASKFAFETRSRLFIYQAPVFWGSLDLCETPEAFAEKKKLGPDAISLPPAKLIEILRCSRGKIKAAMMDQHRVAGLGNVYVDEILFQSKIHPEASADKLPESELKKIPAQTKRVLQQALNVDADRNRMPVSFLMRHRKTDRKCPKGHGALKISRVGGRETFFCASCQKTP